MTPYQLRQPTDAQLRAVLAAQARCELSYPYGGSTRQGLPDGYRHDRHERRLGKGPGAFRNGKQALRTWQVHRASGLHVVASEPVVAAGANVVMVLRLGPMFVVAACRVVYVIDEGAVFGFAYGTLPLHPEEGESRFVVTTRQDETVLFQITLFSRPHDRFATLVPSLTRRVQRSLTGRYLEAMSALTRP